MLTLVYSGGRPSWPRTTPLTIHGIPYTVVADLKADLLVLASIARS